MSYIRDFLGSGWKFPPRLDSRGRVELAHDEHDVEEAIRIILFTQKGERVMRPEFGSEIHTLQFAPMNDHTYGLANRYVREALARWEPRIEVEDVEVGTYFNRDGALRIEIKYRLLATNSERNLVFPFYVIPGED